jgi:hypothetical protein
MTPTSISRFLLLEVNFGFAGKHVARMEGGSVATGRLHNVVVTGGLLPTLIVLIVISRVAHKALTVAVSKAVDETAVR